MTTTNDDGITEVFPDESMEIEGALKVEGAATLDSTLAVAGAASVGGALTVTGEIDLGGALDVAGNFSVATNKMTVAAATGNTLVAGTLTSTGAVEADSTLGADGDFRVGAAGASTTTIAAATGNTIVGGTLTSTGAVEADSTLGADGDFRVGAAGASTTTIAAATGNTVVGGTLTTAGMFADATSIAAQAITIATGSITPDGSAAGIALTPEGGAPDDLTAIDITNLPADGAGLLLINASAFAITLKHLSGGGNLDLTTIGGGTDDVVLNAGDTFAMALSGANMVRANAANSTIQALENIEDSVGPDQLAVTTDFAAVPIVLTVPLGAGNPVAIYTTDAPFAFRVIGYSVLCTGANGGGTATLENGTTAITDAVACATDTNLTYAATIDDAQHEVAAGGSMRITKNAAGDTGIAYVTIVKI